MYRIVIFSYLFCMLQNHAPGQALYPVDECFFSLPQQLSFVTGFDLAGNDADLMQWNGVEWSGSWTNAFITVPPPSNRVGCRAVFIGSGTWWNAPGEGFGMRLNQSMVAGQLYTFPFVYISHGYGSNGAFSPILSSNNAPVFVDAEYIMNLPPVGINWEKHIISFTATRAQEGHNWIFLSTTDTVSSGMVSSFCEGCTAMTTDVSETFKNEMLSVYPNPVSNVLHVMNSGNAGFSYEIFTTEGAVILESDKNAFTDKESIDVSSLDNGLYFLRINNSSGTVLKKFVRKGE